MTGRHRSLPAAHLVSVSDGELCPRVLRQPQTWPWSWLLSPGMAGSTSCQRAAPWSPPPAASRLSGPRDNSQLRTRQGGEPPVQLMAAELALGSS